MPTTRAERIIEAPIDEVFHAIADAASLACALPHVVSVEFLTPQRSGVGTRFRETREWKGRVASMVLEIVECVDAERLRLRADARGTTWDSSFAVEEVGPRTRLVYQLRGQATHWLPRLVNPWLRRGLARAVEADLDAVKAWCER